MRRLVVFNMVSLDGYFTDAKGDMSWAHKSDPEWDTFVQENASGGGVLLFGRKTYEMMVSFWPTPQAQKTAPVVAERMNALPKVVFSKTLREAKWQNTKLVKDDLVGAVKKMKAEDGPDLVIMGSGTVVSQVTRAGLVDLFQIVVNPIVIGAGRTMFEGVDGRVTLKRTATRTFANGNVVIDYEPA